MGVCLSVYQGRAKVPLPLSPLQVSFLSSTKISLVMSSASNTTSNFETIFNAALANYTKQTGKDLRNHPLASKIDSSDSPDSILDIFQEQAQAFDEFRRGKPGDTELFKSLEPVVNVLLPAKDVLRHSVGYVSPTMLLINHIFKHSVPQAIPHAKLVLSAIGILLSVCISLPISAPPLVTIETARRPNMWGPVTTPWSTSSNAPRTFLTDSRFIPKFHLLPI